MSNPLLDLTGLPRFSAIRPEHVEPAVERILSDNRAGLRGLLDDGAATDWDSLVEPLEAMAHRLSRVWAPVGHLNAVVNSEPLREAYNRCLPRLTEYATEIGQNEALCRAYEEIAARAVGLGQAQRKVLEHALRDFRLSGVALPCAEKARFRALMR
jgi:oligopeptidase A